MTAYYPTTDHIQQYPGGGGVLQPGAHYLQQHQQAQQQMMSMAARSSMFYGSHPYPCLQQQQQLGMSSGGSNGLMLQGELHGEGFPDFIRGDGLPGNTRALAGGSKRDHEGRGGSDHNGSDETHYLKGGDDGN